LCPALFESLRLLDVILSQMSNADEKETTAMSDPQKRETPLPEFTIIIPCWNAELTLRATLDSIMAQDLQNWECIIVDDGSTDDTRYILADYCLKDQRFRTLSTLRNGPSGARNLAGLKYAKAQYLAFLDSDDIWHPNKLSRTLAAFESDSLADGFYAQIAFFKIDPKRPETHSTVYPRLLRPIDFLRDNPVCTMSNLVIKTALFKVSNGFDQTIVHNEDVEFLVRVTARGARIAGIQECLVDYRTSVTGLSSNLKSMRAGWHRALESLQSSDFRLSPAQIAEADAGNLRYLSRRALRTGAPGFEALRLAIRGISRSPKSFFSPSWRGCMTLLGAFIAPFLPRKIRAFTFSR
jgi:glycosyltransferase involved in cell wall biosynthesis